MLRPSWTAAILALYVDDFKLAGPRKNLAEGWRLLKQSLSIEAAKPIGLYLGCHHVVSSAKHADGTNLVVMQYNIIWRTSYKHAWSDARNSLAEMRDCKASARRSFPKAQIPGPQPTFVERDQRSNAHGANTRSQPTVVGRARPRLAPVALPRLVDAPARTPPRIEAPCSPLRPKSS